MTFEKFMTEVSTELNNKFDARAQKKQNQSYSFSNDSSFTESVVKQEEIEYARLENTKYSFAKFMSVKNDRTMMFVTFTFGKESHLKHHSEDVYSIASHLEWQAKSAAYHIRRLLKSKKFRRAKNKPCAIDDPIHYMWSLELQEKGDIHLHAAFFLKDEPQLIKDFILRFHEQRAKHPYAMPCYVSEKKPEQYILPLGRCHFGLHPKHRALMEELSFLEQKEKLQKDKRTSYDPKRYEYFMTDISHVKTFTGEGTAIEFYDAGKLKQLYEELGNYMTKIAMAKYSRNRDRALRKGAVYKTTLDHHLKGKKKSDSAEKQKLLAMHADVFTFIGVSTLHYSQALFQTKLYQSLWSQLTWKRPQYKSLFNITMDLCREKVRVETVVVDGYTFKQVVHADDGVIAGEQFKKGALDAK